MRETHDLLGVPAQQVLDELVAAGGQRVRGREGVGRGVDGFVAEVQVRDGHPEPSGRSAASAGRAAATTSSASPMSTASATWPWAVTLARLLQLIDLPTPTRGAAEPGAGDLVLDTVGSATTPPDPCCAR